MYCKICKKQTTNSFKNKILNKYIISYFYCELCDFIFTEEPYWLNEAYRSAINQLDTGAIRRNILQSLVSTSVITNLFSRKGTFLDYAGGHGVLTRMMRDIGLDFKWQDNYARNVFACGFEYKNDEKIDLITAFEVFEHFSDPLNQIQEMLKISNNILFSTTIKKDKIPKKDWWYYGQEHGQHVSFYSVKSLEIITKKNNLNLYTNKKNIHLITNKKINKHIFKLIVSIKFGLILYIKSIIFLKSKIQSDHKILKSKTNL